MTFIKKIVYGLLIASTIFFGFSNVGFAKCEDPTKIQLNTKVPGVELGEDRCLDPKEATNNFGGLMGGMMKVFINITVAVAFLMLVASGVMIAMGGADQGMASKGKELFKKVLIGLLLIGLSGLILHTINPNFWTVDKEAASTE